MRRNSGSLQVWIAWPEKFAICGIGQQALFAFVDVLAKTFLTCVPEPPRDVHDQAVARGKARYDSFSKA